MKLGILTFHSAHNYGAVLQAFGLQEYLRSRGHDALIIDYRPGYITNCYPKDGSAFWKNSNLTECAKGLYNYYVHSNIRHRRWDNFEQFISSQLNLYPYRAGMDFHDFDAVFIGSDQVWSKAHTGGHYDPMFFGEGFKCKVIPYAPSCTSLSLNDEDKAFFKQHLDQMAAVSVREYKMKGVLQPLTKKEITVVVDPSLLAGKECFDVIAADVKTKRPYILIYEIIGHPEVYLAAKALAKKMDADIVELVNGMCPYHRSTMREDASPEEFLGYIKHASCVLTSSFHGTAFSLMFNKPFYTILQGNAVDNRMVSLLKALDMMDRTIALGDTPCVVRPLHETTAEKIKGLVKSSEGFIAESIG